MLRRKHTSKTHGSVHSKLFYVLLSVHAIGKTNSTVLMCTFLKLKWMTNMTK